MYCLNTPTSKVMSSSSHTQVNQLSNQFVIPVKIDKTLPQVLTITNINIHWSVNSSKNFPLRQTFLYPSHLTKILHVQMRIQISFQMENAIDECLSFHMLLLIIKLVISLPMTFQESAFSSL